MAQLVSGCLSRALQTWTNCSYPTRVIVGALAAIAAVGALFAAARSLFCHLFSKSVSSPKVSSTPQEAFDAMLALVKQYPSLAKEVQNIPADWRRETASSLEENILKDSPVAYGKTGEQSGKTGEQSLIFVRGRCPQNPSIIEVICLGKNPSRDSGEKILSAFPLSSTHIMLPSTSYQLIHENLQRLLKGERVPGTIPDVSSKRGPYIIPVTSTPTEFTLYSAQKSS